MSALSSRCRASALYRFAAGRDIRISVLERIAAALDVSPVCWWGIDAKRLTPGALPRHWRCLDERTRQWVEDAAGMPWGRRGLWSRAAVRIKALDADCDRPANAEQGEQKWGDATDVIAHESPPITREWASWNAKCRNLSDPAGGLVMSSGSSQELPLSMLP